MKITLKNFGCWADKSFDFKNDSMNLLSGPSGFGKTTVLRAIVFALFGEHARRITEKCRVVLEYGDFVITRTKKPNHLTVVYQNNPPVEDKIAQELVDKHFGDMSMIYLEQNGRHTFVNMTPSEKLKYLEKIIFSHRDITKTKEKIKNVSKKYEESILLQENNSQMLVARMEELERNLVFTRENPEPNIRSNRQEYSECSKQQAQFRQKKQEVNVYLERSKNIESVIQTKQDELNVHQTTLKRYNSKLENLATEEELMAELTALYSEERNRRRMDEIATIRETIQKKKEQFAQVVNTEKGQLDEKIQEIYQVISSEFPVATLRKFIKTGQNYLDYTRRKNALQVELSQIKYDRKRNSEILAKIRNVKAQIEHVKEQQSHINCPNCNIYLQIKNGKITRVSEASETVNVSMEVLLRELEQYEDEMQEWLNTKMRHETCSNQLTEVQTAIANLETRIATEYDGILVHPNFDAIVEAIARSEKKVEEMIVLQTELERLKEERKRVEQRFQLLSNEISDLERQRDKLEKKCKPTERALAEISGLISTKNAEFTQVKEYSNLANAVCREMEKLEDELEELKSFSERRFTESDLQRLEEQEIQNTERMHVLVEQLNDLYQQKENYSKTIELEQLKAELAKINGSLIDAQSHYSASVLLTNLTQKAETIALEAVVENINLTAQDYLTAFFVEDPMEARISLVKEKGTKNEKQQIFITVHYKGMVMDVDLLSGGEYDRVVLAFMLSLMELNQSSLILLDECISSLDLDTATNVCEFIHQRSRNRCVILIAHQIVTGIFDNVLLIDSV